METRLCFTCVCPGLESLCIVTTLASSETDFWKIYIRNSTMVDKVGEERDDDDDTTTVQAPDDEEYNEIYTDEEIIKTKTSLGQAKNVNVFLMAVILLKYIF